MAKATTGGEVPRIELDEAKRRFDARTALFVDVRGAGDYENGHIPGALSIPLSGPPERYFTLPRDQDIVLY